MVREICIHDDDEVPSAEIEPMNVCSPVKSKEFECQRGPWLREQRTLNQAFQTVASKSIPVLKLLVNEVT